MPLSYGEIARIVDMVESSALDELVIDVPGTKLAVRRGGDGDHPDVASMSNAVTPDAAPPPAPRAESSVPSARSDSAVKIYAPMVGTFRRSRSSGGPPLTEIGNRVAPGQPLALIEVLRNLTAVEAPQAGRIVDIAAADGALVEYGQILFVITTA